MDLLHAIILHQVFGRGEIVEQDGEMISVTFAKPYGKKKFLFPEAFQQHLSLEDGALQSEVDKMLEKSNLLLIKEQARAERSERIARYRASSVEKSKANKKTKKAAQPKK